MRKLFMPLALLLAGAIARPASCEGFLDVQGAAGLTGGIYMSRTEAGTTFDHDRYAISARVRTQRFGDAARGSREEYSAALTRELYHVTVTGRLGTSPPSSQRTAYHLAGGEAWLNFYGLTLGPEHPERSAAVWESSGAVPSPESLDRTWVTRFGGVYSNIDNHLEGTANLPALVENVWQFRLFETYKQGTTLGLEGGGVRYSQVLGNRVAERLLSDIDYLGNVLPVAGWPNNWAGATVSQKLGVFRLTAAGTRLNLLDNELETMYSGSAALSLSERWSLNTGYEHKRRRRSATREALWLGASYRW